MTPTPSPSPSGSPAPDTLYVQEGTTKAIREYQGASALNGLATAKNIYPTQDNSWGDVIYNPVTDTLWYVTAVLGGGGNHQFVDFWQPASTENNQNPNVKVPFTSGEGTMAYDPTHNLLYVASQAGPQIAVFTNPSGLTAASIPAAVITAQITDGSSPRPQEMVYDAAHDTLYASDTQSAVACFDGFGTAAQNAVNTSTNPTIPADRYMTGLFSPDGLAYSAASDVLFVGEQQGNFLDVINGASTFSGGVTHAQEITGFSHIGGLALDDTSRDILYVYDTVLIYSIPNANAASGPLSRIPDLHTIEDSSGSQNDGFGIYVDSTH